MNPGNDEQVRLLREHFEREHLTPVEWGMVMAWRHAKVGIIDRLSVRASAEAEIVVLEQRIDELRRRLVGEVMA